MLGFKTKLFQPSFPLVSFLVSFQIKLTPFFTAIVDIDVTVVLRFFQFATKLLQRFLNCFRFLGVVNMLGFPFWTMVGHNFGGLQHADKTDERSRAINKRNMRNQCKVCIG